MEPAKGYLRRTSEEILDAYRQLLKSRKQARGKKVNCDRPEATSFWSTMFSAPSCCFGRRRSSSQSGYGTQASDDSYGCIKPARSDSLGKATPALATLAKMLVLHQTDATTGTDSDETPRITVPPSPSPTISLSASSPSIISPQYSPPSHMPPPPPAPGPVLAHGSHMCQGSRSSMEDAHSTHFYCAGHLLPAAMGLNGPLLMVTVADGHNGDRAAFCVRDNMEFLIMEATAQLAATQLQCQGLAVSPEAILQRALAAMEHELVHRGAAGPVAGTTVLVSLVAPVDGVIYTANIGDCRAVMSAVGASGFPTTTTLTTDHRPADNAEEAARLAEAGVQVDSSGYISHAVASSCSGETACSEPLQLSRSLGDPQFKAAAGNTLLATPTIAVHTIPSGAQFLLLATDGIWDKLRANDAARIVRQALEGRGSGAEDDAARALVSAARKQQGPDDNVAVVVVRVAEITKRASRFARPVV